MREAQILCEKVVSTQAQSRYGIQLTVACREEDDRQLCRQRPELPAQLEATFRLIFQRDVDDREVRQTRRESGHGLCPVGVGTDDIAFACECGGIIVTN